MRVSWRDSMATFGRMLLSVAKSPEPPSSVEASNRGDNESASRSKHLVKYIAIAGTFIVCTMIFTYVTDRLGFRVQQPNEPSRSGDSINLTGILAFSAIAALLAILFRKTFGKLGTSNVGVARAGTNSWSKRHPKLAFFLWDNAYDDAREIGVISFLVACLYAFILGATLLISLKRSAWSSAAFGTWYNTVPWLALLISYVGIVLVLFCFRADFKGNKAVGWVFAIVTTILSTFALFACLQAGQRNKLGHKITPYAASIAKATGSNWTYPRITESQINEELSPELHAIFEEYFPNEFKRRRQIRICYAESRLNHFDPDNNTEVYKNVNLNGSTDYGLCQMNDETWYDYGERKGYSRDKWPAAAQDKGLDIMTPRGNIAFAAILEQERGTQPWKASEARWKIYTDDPKAEMELVEVLTPTEKGEWTRIIPSSQIAKRGIAACIDWSGESPYEYRLYGKDGNMIGEYDWSYKKPFGFVYGYQFRTKPPATGSALVTISVQPKPPHDLDCDGIPDAHQK